MILPNEAWDPPLIVLFAIVDPELRLRPAHAFCPDIDEDLIVGSIINIDQPSIPIRVQRKEEIAPYSERPIDLLFRPLQWSKMRGDSPRLSVALCLPARWTDPCLYFSNSVWMVLWIALQVDFSGMPAGVMERICWHS